MRDLGQQREEFIVDLNTLREQLGERNTEVEEMNRYVQLLQEDLRLAKLKIASVGGFTEEFLSPMARRQIDIHTRHLSSEPWEETSEIIVRQSSERRGLSQSPKTVVEFKG